MTVHYYGKYVVQVIYSLSLSSSLYTIQTSIDVLPSKNQALCEFCTRVNQLKHC